MEKKIFREKSLNTISSPEQLNDYIKVTTPSVWVILGAVAALLIGFIIWGVFGTLKTTFDSYGIAKNGTVECWISEKEIDKITVGQTVSIGNAEGKISSVAATPVSYKTVSGRVTDEYALHVMNLDDWNYEVTAAASGVPDGLVKLAVTTDSANPLSYILN